MALNEGLTIRLIDAPAFVATKLEAFKGRGNGDFLLSHDLEDIVAVVDGRPGLIDEVRAAPEELRRYLADEFGAMMSTPAFLEALAGHLPGDAMSQRRLPGLMATLKRLAGTE